jgi:hypothetical protein
VYNITLNIVPLKNLPRKVGSLKAAMTERKMKWKHQWADNVDLEKRLTSTDLEDIKLVNAALQASTLEPIHLQT